MPSQECARLEYGGKSKHLSASNYAGKEISSVLGQKRKSLCDGDFFVTPEKIKKCIASYAVRLPAQGGDAIHCKLMLTNHAYIF